MRVLRQLTSAMRLTLPSQKPLHNTTFRDRIRPISINVTLVAARLMSILHGHSDQYNGLTIDLHRLGADISEAQFDHMLTENLSRWQQEHRSAVWLQMGIEQSNLIRIAAEAGFTFHHAEDRTMVMKIWLREGQTDKTPPYATHQVGASGIVLREDTKQVLMVQDRFKKFTKWKFPGGLSELGEDLGRTAEREVFEETGVRAEFQSVLGFREQHKKPSSFGRSDIYVVCRLSPLTFDLKPCQEEIVACDWIFLDDVLQDPEVAIITRRLCALLKQGLREGFRNVDIVSEQYESVHWKLTNTFYHRPLSDEE